MEARHQIIDFAVQLEYNIAHLICAWLGIDRENSRSFGTKSSSLSFYQQTNLILDMNVLNKEEAKKLECFGQIRNKFAHDVDIKSYSDCLSSNKDLKNKLSKFYPPKHKIDKELDSMDLVLKLMFDMAIINEILLSKLNERHK
jgi:hypothetical protein